jgi:hypothetical protein
MSEQQTVETLLVRMVPRTATAFPATMRAPATMWASVLFPAFSITFAQPPDGYFGDSPRNALRSLGVANLDLSFFKSIQFERLGIQFRFASAVGRKECV